MNVGMEASDMRLGGKAKLTTLRGRVEEAGWTVHQDS